MLGVFYCPVLLFRYTLFVYMITLLEIIMLMRTTEMIMLMQKTETDLHNFEGPSKQLKWICIILRVKGFTAAN